MGGQMGDSDTYTALQFKDRKKIAEKEFTRTPACHPVAVALGTTAALLLLAVIALTVLIFRGPCDNSIHQHGHPEEGTEPNAWRLTRLRDHLCIETAKENADSGCVLCPNGWLLVRGTCFYFSEEQKSWSSSQLFCLREKSNLHLIQDEADMDLIDSKRDNSAYLWTGMSYKRTPGAWIHLNGTVIHSYRVPVSSQSTVDACGAYRNREIYPEVCSSSKKFICEKPAILFDP
ncbi:killer cell lectin-like receptor subfamily F member 1 [Lissotriton helveticus]